MIRIFADFIKPPRRRFAIRGAEHVIFYGVPEYEHFYCDIVNLMGKKSSSNLSSGSSPLESWSCLTLYSVTEAMALERVVGKERSVHMLKSRKGTFMFC